MKKGQVLEGIIERVDFPNKGIINIEGTRVIVKNGIPGQKVRFSVNKVRSSKCEGRLLEVLEKAPEEQEALCPHFPDCGGCTYQNLPYENQLQMKEEQVRRLLDSVCSDYKFEGIKASPEQYGYRNKMEFSFGDEYKDGPLALGMHRRGSFYDIVTSFSCQIVDADYRKILDATLEFARESGLSFYHKITHQGYFRHLLIRRGKRSGEILVDLITSSQAGEMPAGADLQAEGKLADLHMNLQAEEMTMNLLSGSSAEGNCTADETVMSSPGERENEGLQGPGDQAEDPDKKYWTEKQGAGKI